MATYRWVVSYLKPYAPLLVLFVLCGLLVTSIEIAIAKFVQHFIDVIAPSGRTASLYRIIGMLCGFVVLMLGAQAWRNVLQRKIQELASRDLMVAMFRHLRKLGFAYYEQHPVGETVGLFQTEVAAVQRIYRVYVPTLIQYSVTLIVLTALLIELSWQLTVWIVPFFMSYYLLGPYFEKKASVWAKDVNKERQLANKRLYDTFAAIHEMRAFGGERWSIARLMQQFAVLHAKQLTQYFYAYMRGTVRRVTIGLGAVAIFAYGITLVRDGHMTVGEFVVYSIFYGRLLGTMTAIVTLTTEQRLLLQQASILHDFIRQIPSVQEELVPTRLPEIRGAITFDNVSFGYPARPEVIRHFSLHIAHGQKVALIGTSGGGKSTLLKLVARFYDPVGGEIRLDGIPLKKLSFEQLRSSIGYVFQETYLFGGTVRENIQFGLPDATDEQMVAAAKAAYAHDFIEKLPEGYDTIIGERGIKLSGGQKQRLAIARMFIKNPSIVLLDEATSALDNISEYEVQKALDSLLAGRTTIAVAHRLSTVRHFDQMVVIDEGQNAEQGTYEELLAKGGLLRNLIQGQQERRTAYE
ncbi:ABC transporter ATP-binding protein [Paenibacillus koleovorans]|uniref:ABC transporter ATP-binding protein n=1 Tax=Paenibacillus koleovorans TaxID=121608 RepID=UPI000FDB5914|nr:ABC transporter ATP-binding protein [Paenibacillus koleovorans]